MLKKLMIVMFAVVMIFPVFSVNAQNGPLPVPVLQDGKYVYTIPESFDPPLIGPSGINELNVKIRMLKFPFYVVLVKNLPGYGDDDKRAAAAVDGLVQDWAERYSEFDMAKSQVFLLAYEPRKFAFLAGAKFKAELGFERNAHKPYTTIFEKYVSGTPKDPKNGMIAMMKAVDEYLFEQTDPVRIAQRLEEARRANEARRQQLATSALDAEILRLSQALQSSAEFLPDDLLGYRAMLENAQGIRQANDPEDMLTMAASMKPDTDVLMNYVSGKRRDYWSAKIWLIVKLASLIALLGTAIYLLRRRRRMLDDLRCEFAEVENDWRTKISNASGRYVNIYGERDSVQTLVSGDKNRVTEGKTKELYDRVTVEVDDIYSQVTAMKFHIDECRDLAAKGGYFNFKPICSALAVINSPFDFDTGIINERDLFAQMTKHIKVYPSFLVADLEKRFSANQADWSRLKNAADLRFTVATELFSHDKMNEMFQLAGKNGIPDRWLSGHPLFGDDASDKNFYDSLDAFRNSDPICYLDCIEEAKNKEQEIEQELNRLVVALKLAQSKRLKSAPAIEGVVTDPDDDPDITFNQARREEDKLAGRLAAADSVAEIEEKASQVHKLYQKCAEQVATIVSATVGASKSITQAQTAQSETVSDQKSALDRVVLAGKIHKTVKAHSYIVDGQLNLEAGSRELEKAKRQVQERKYVNASRTADESNAQFQKARVQFHEVMKHCDALDKQKAEYEQKVANAESNRKQYEKKIRGYGGSTRLSDFAGPSLNGAMDYAVLLVLYNNAESSWQSDERQARSAYEDTERARRAAEAAAQRKRDDEAAAERRHQDSIRETSVTVSSWGNDSVTSASTGDW